ncbi:MAG: hypothetical protein M1832_001830 [Thelocarpon impressellum]|nr:MAG: hypothetical protein M1832_001830 [Thelocarpon impressellum]
MQVAEILSDLTSFRLCGHTEALALVNAPKTIAPLSSDVSFAARAPPISALVKDAKAAPSPGAEENNADLARAFDLMELHKTVKLRHAEGVDAGLQRARRDVEEVMGTLSQR